MNKLPNEALIVAFKNGNQAGFDFLFRQYYTALCYFANSILNNEEEAKDIVQDCFVGLWNSPKIKRPETIKSFLYTSVRNGCIDILRKKKVVLKAKSYIINNSTNDFEYFDEVAFAEMIRQIVDHIELLSPRMQQVIKLYFFEQNNCEEIAGIMGTTSGSVRKQKQRALKIIRGKMPFLLTFILLYQNYDLSSKLNHHSQNQEYLQNTGS